MADVKIADLLTATTVADNDLFIVEDNADTKKITKNNLKEALGVNSKANKTQEGWTEPTLLNGWVNFGGSDPTAAYYKDEFGVVHLKGQIKSGTITDGTFLFTLPSGYGSSKNMQFPLFVKSPISFGTLSINGYNVRIFDVTANDAVYLNDISFRADM